MQVRVWLVVGAFVGLAVGAFAVPAGGDALPPVSVDKTRVLVLFRGGLPAELPELAAQLGARVADVWAELDGALLEAPTEAAGEALLQALLARGDVAAAEFDFAYRLHVTPNDPRWIGQWGLRAIKAPEAWDITFGSHVARIALLDTGADLDHEDLAANICGGRNFFNSGPPEDDNDHGSHTAGIAGAVTNNARGVAGTSQSCLLIAKVCDSGGNCDISKVTAAISWAINPDGNSATDDRAHVVSMSFGGPVPSNALQLAMQVAWNNGILLVASAGNEFCAPVGYPAAYDTVVAVGGLEVLPIVGVFTGMVTGQEEFRAIYSNCGVQLELAAPGTSILSTARDNQYKVFSGTSMSAPFVAGVAGLVKAANPALTNAQIRCVLDTSAHDYGTPFRDVEYGYGKLRADRAVSAAANGANCIPYQLGIGLNVPPLPPL